MEIRGQIIDLVEKFLIVADNLLREGKIDEQTHRLMTENKVRFLDLVGVESEYSREHNNG